jgi:hypothetical protein
MRLPDSVYLIEAHMNILYTYTASGGNLFVKKTVFEGSYIHIESMEKSYILPVSLVQFSRGDFAMGGVWEV